MPLGSARVHARTRFGPDFCVLASVCVTRALLRDGPRAVAHSFDKGLIDLAAACNK